MAGLTDILREYWGYGTFLPLQEEAMNCVLKGRDSVVVLPTGGGKSLCFQAPALAMEGMALVVSPLISLMKDQVDALRSNGVAAACINSTVTQKERYLIDEEIRAGTLKLLYVAPERLLAPGFIDYLANTTISFVAIDEAHCISAWGHDFRPEYRGLGRLREAFPGIALHSYTATATEKVRIDIAEALTLQTPEILVGSFDRPNLIYKVQPSGGKAEREAQVLEIIRRHPNESGIVYCITRKETAKLADTLTGKGYRAQPYHAGMTTDARERSQEAFIREDIDIVVATVAFGMGIDKPNVRYVIHAGMPKSIEHYQQESGRAGRDGLEAECHLLFASGDFGTWSFILGKTESEGAEIALQKLAEINDFCTGVTCRHRALVTYFGQDYQGENCGACDICLGEVDQVDGALEITQKIISCVLRLDERFGAAHTTKVLAGSREAKIVDWRHDKLSTWGILSEFDWRAIRNWVEQLVSQDFLAKTGEFNVLKVTRAGRNALRGEGQPILLKPVAPKKERKTAATVAIKSWTGVDRDLFEALRELRRGLAAERGVPAYVIFGDTALRDMARIQPTTEAQFLTVRGVGAKKSRDYSEIFLGEIAKHATADRNETEAGPSEEEGSLYATAVEEAKAPIAKPKKRRQTKTKEHAFKLLRQGQSVEDVARQIARVPKTVLGYLVEHIEEENITDPTPWVDPETADRIHQAARACGTDRLRPIFDHLQAAVPYECIRVALACRRNLDSAE